MVLYQSTLLLPPTRTSQSTHLAGDTTPACIVT